MTTTHSSQHAYYWLIWVLAHELGHYFAKINPQLFSPFIWSGAAAHQVSVFSRRRWGRWRRLHPAEDRANQWAAKTLIDKDRWNQAEKRTPLDLRAIAAALELPIPAVLTWERLRRAMARGASYVPIDFDAPTWSAIEEAASGRGGHQSLFSRIQKNRNASRTLLSFGDFSLARERAVSIGGGWRVAYDRLLKAVFPEIQRAGGVNELFALE